MTVRIEGTLAATEHHVVGDAHLVIVGCGYESRSRAIAERFSFPKARKCALLFSEHRVLAFEKNKSVLQAKGFEFHDLPDEELSDWLCDQTQELLTKTDSPIVVIDVSSQTRGRIAGLVEGIVRGSAGRLVRVIFGYHLARYTPPIQVDAPTLAIGPISPYFAGWTSDPGLPTCLIVGLGYERDRALGAVEYLEPTSVWALLPRSSEGKYDHALLDANAQLLKSLGDRRICKYEVEDPNMSLALLSSLISRTLPHSGVILLPSGPKVLTLISLLIAAANRDVSVWRISAGAFEPPVDRKAKGPPIFVDCQIATRSQELLVAAS